MTDYLIDLNGNVTLYNKKKKKNQGGNKDSYFKSGGFSDGVDSVGDFFGDLGQTVAGTVGDIGVGIGKGATRTGEGILDLINYGAAGVADLLGAEEFAKQARDNAQYNITDESWMDMENLTDPYSVLGNKSDGITEGIGQVGTMILTGAAGGAAGLGAKGVTALTSGLVGTSAMGSGMSEAYASGATDAEAFKYGLISGTAEAATEALFGGLGKLTGATGLSRSLLPVDDALAKKVSGMFSNQIAKNFAEYGIKAGAEGFEEVLAGIGQAWGKKVTYKSKEELWDLIQDEQLLDQFIAGAVTSGIAQSGYVPGMQQGSLREANATGRDFITGNTQNEQKVIDKVVEDRIKEKKDAGEKVTAKVRTAIEEGVQRDLERGYISTDTIEGILGGKTYENYKALTDQEKALKKEIDTLVETLDNTPVGQITDEQLNRLREITEQIAALDVTSVKNQLSSEVSELVRSDRLLESYNEKARRSQAFEADLSQYDEKQRVAIQNAINSGILNNTNRTHEFVDLIAKISADKGVSFNFTNNEKLKESGFALEGRTVNGYVEGGNVTLNVNSAKALNKVVGHEITHVLKGTDFYDTLQDSIIAYAKSKGDYDARIKSLEELYSDVKDADINEELTADLVGDYLFTDEDFIRNLSTEQPNIFKKIYEEIKYFVKTVAPGSKEAKQLEKVKRAFEKAYKEVGNNSISEAKYSIKIDNKGKEYWNIDTQKDIFKGLRTTREVEKAAYEYILQQRDNEVIVSAIDGKEMKFIRISAEEFTNSEESKDLKETNPVMFAQKMRLIPSVEDLAQNANINWWSPDQKKHKLFKQGGFENFRGRVRIDDVIFNYVIRSGKAKFGDVFYDINLEVDQILPHTNGASGIKKSTSKNSISQNEEKSSDLKQKQLDIILNANPAEDSYHTWIRDTDDILTFEEALNSDDYIDYKGEDFDDSYPYSVAENALETGKITVYSSYPIEQGVFVTPSMMEAQSYAGNGKVYSKEVALTDVAWIDPTQGQYANVNKQFSINEDNTGRSLTDETKINEITDEGLTMTYVRVPNQNTQNYGSTYGQNIEPTGEYMSMDTMQGEYKIDGYEYGTIRFKKPLVLEHIDSSDAGWKKTVSDMYNGLTGKKLTKALIKDGYDAIVTYDEYGYSEIVNLNGTKLDSSNNAKMSLSDKEDTSSPGTYNVYGSDIELEELELPIREDVAPVQQEDVDELPIREDLQTQDTSLPDDLPIRDDVVVPEEGYPTKPVQTVQERIEAKINNQRIELQRIRQLREETHDDYNSLIAQKQAQYKSKKRKNTKTAREILQQIEGLKKRRDDAEADFEKKISDREARIAKMSTPEFKTAAQRKSKHEEHRALMRELMGDTSTWRDKKLGLQYRVNTLRRNLRDIVRGADGERDIARADAIYEELQGTYNHNEALLNREAAEIKQPFAELKINKYENAYIQMLGEYRDNPDTTIKPEDIQDYYEAHKRKIDTDKVERVISEARKTYDSLFARVNEVLVEQGFKPLEYRKGYFPHFTENQGWLTKLFNWKVQDNTIPTDIAGMTEMFNPERSWQSFDKHRTGDDTDYSFKTGFDTYVKGALDWIYHIDDIQKRRAFENEIRYQHSEQGVRDAVEEIHANEDYDADEMQAAIDTVYRNAKNPLNNLVQDLRRGTNNLAGKKDSYDREMEGDTNRQVYSVMTNVSNRVSANMVAGSFSSALTNFIPITQSWGEVSPISSLKAMKDTIRSVIRDDGMIEKSDFMTNRLRPMENLNKTAWDKIGDKVGFLMEAVDFFTTQTVWRSKYSENIKKGMSESEAIHNADDFAEGLMAGRSRGNMPTAFNAKNPFAKMVTAFQLEVANQYGYMFKDMPQNIGENAKGKLIKGYLTMFAGAYAYNMLYSNLTGRDAALDPIGIIKDFLNDLFGDDEEEGDALKAVAGLGINVAQEIPFVGGLLGGGRVPLSNALPFDGDYSELMNAVGEGDGTAILKEMLNPLYYLALPMGGGQLRKTMQGLSMFDDDLPIAGSYTDSGGLRFPVEDTPLNRLQAGMFGQWANENAQDYIENGRSPLKEKQIQEFVDVDIPIADYWKYREGLKEQGTLEEKFDYIADLDLPVAKKNILINNIVNRDEEVDMEEYDEFADYDEFDFAIKNPEKYDFLQENGISYEDYQSSEDSKAAYNWAYNNPEKYTISRAVTDDVVQYRVYTKAISAIKADKDAKGKSVSGSAKKKVVQYLNGLDIDYGAKLILFRQKYNSDDKYNNEIVEYLNNRDDISRSEMVLILEELGFTVDAEGNVTW